jgi:hypothetical protein
LELLNYNHPARESEEQEDLDVDTSVSQTGFYSYHLFLTTQDPQHES